MNSLRSDSVILSALILLKISRSKSLWELIVFSLDSSYICCSVFTGTTITGAGAGAGSGLATGYCTFTGAGSLGRVTVLTIGIVKVGLNS